MFCIRKRLTDQGQAGSGILGIVEEEAGVQPVGDTEYQRGILEAQSQQGIQSVHFELKVGIDFGESCAGQIVSLPGELSGIESAGAEKY